MAPDRHLPGYARRSINSTDLLRLLVRKQCSILSVANLEAAYELVQSRCIRLANGRCDGAQPNVHFSVLSRACRRRTIATMKADRS